jgi:SAM-dependent methyltransferase
MTKEGYLLDNAWTQARERLGLLETSLDPGSIRHLERLGVDAGWQCLDVGAGGGSISEWLCRRVGPRGRVLATDVDTRFLDALEYPNLEVMCHDIANEALPERSFDLVFARAVLTHLAGRDVALRRMAAALKPGGKLLVEEVDVVSCVPDPRFQGATLYEEGWAAAVRVFSAGGADVHYGRRLYGDICAAGLVDVDAEGRVLVVRAGTPLARFWQLTVAQLRDQIIPASSLTNDRMDQFLALHDAKDFIWLNNIIMAVWGKTIE